MRVKLIGLVRVSTPKQGDSGLGLEAQEHAIEEHRKSVDGVLIKTYVEIESGTHNSIDDRPQLRAAVAHARRSGATLVIAKMDRLVRSVPVGSYLKTAGIKFVACDQPYANEFTLDILFAVAANKARQISTRTKEALAAYKARGGKLGGSLPQCRNLTPEGRARGVARSSTARHAKAIEAYADIAPYMVELRSQGLSLWAIAKRLDQDGHTTRTGKQWNQVQVMRVLRRVTSSPSTP